jgi:peptidoglycan endopeptidase LytF
MCAQLGEDKRMSRRDTIIIAVLVNAGILLVLFALAMPSKEETESVSNVAEKIETVAGAEQPLLTTVSDAQPAVIDEIDQVLSEWNEQSSTAPIAQTVAEEGDAVAFPIATAAKEEAAPEKATTTAKTVEVVVKKGDALDKIARTHGTTAAEIMKLNHLASTKLQIGQVLLVPDSGKAKAKKAKATSSKSSSEMYTVKSGDNPWTIANKNHIKLEELLKLNDLNEDSAKKLKPGDKIRIK